LMFDDRSNAKTRHITRHPQTAPFGISTVFS
jgi:hypothetical protein